MKKYILIMVIIFATCCVRGELNIGINNLEKPQVTITPVTPPINYSLIPTVNSSQYWGNYLWTDYDMPNIKLYGGINYTTTALGLFVKKSGDTMTGDLNMGVNDILNANSVTTSSVLTDFVVASDGSKSMGFVDSPDEILFDRDVGTPSVSIINMPLKIRSNTQYLYFGASSSASIRYNGTDMLVNPKEVGTGDFIVSGDVIGNTITSIGNLTTIGNYLCNATTCYMTQDLNSTFNITYQNKADYQFTTNNFNGSGVFNTTGTLQSSNQLIYKARSANEFIGTFVTNFGSTNIKMGMLSSSDASFSLGGVWLSQATPSFTNYAFLDGGSSGNAFNAPTGGQIMFRINNGNKWSINGTGDLHSGLDGTAAGNIMTAGNIYVSDIKAININATGNVTYKNPNAMYSDTSTQTVAATGTAYYMDFNTTETSYQITKSSDNINFSVYQNGNYLIEISIMGQSSVANTHLEVWVRKNDVNVARSNTRYEFKGVNSEAVIAVPFMLSLNRTDKFSIMYAGDNTGISLPTTAATAYSPITPSAIMTITRVSDIT